MQSVICVESESNEPCAGQVQPQVFVISTSSITKIVKLLQACLAGMCRSLFTHFCFCCHRKRKGQWAEPTARKRLEEGWGEPQGAGREEGERQGRRHLKAEATHVLTPAPHSGRSGSGPCVFTFCDSGCLMKRANPFPAPARQHHSFLCRSPPGARPRCWHGHSGAGGCIWMCFRAALPQDRLPLASASLRQSGGCS